MIQVYKYSGYVYAENDEEVRQLETKLTEFINQMRNEGRAVTAKKLVNALDKWKGNYFVKKYFER